MVGLLVLTAAVAQADEKKKSRKLAKAAAARAGQWFKVRSGRNLLKKGSGLKATKKNLRPPAVVNAFLGFTPAAYRKAQGSPKAWIDRLYRGRRASFLGQPLLVRSYRLRKVVVHRDAVSVDAEVTFDTAKGETRGIRTVWVKEKSKLVLGLREPDKALKQGKQPTLGPVKAKPLFKSGLAKSTLSGNAFLLQVEELLADRPKPKEAQEKLQKLSLADFGEFAGTTVQDGADVGEVRCGYLLVRIVPADKGDGFEGLKAGDRVLFSGDVTAVRGKNPWRDRTYEREGVTYDQRCVIVTIKGSAGKR